MISRKDPHILGIDHHQNNAGSSSLVPKFTSSNILRLQSSPQQQAISIKLTDDCVQSLQTAAEQDQEVLVHVDKKAITLEIKTGELTSIKFECYLQRVPGSVFHVLQRSQASYNDIANVSMRAQVKPTDKTFQSSREKAVILSKHLENESSKCRTQMIQGPVKPGDKKLNTIKRMIGNTVPIPRNGSSSSLLNSVASYSNLSPLRSSPKISPPPMKSSSKTLKDVPLKERVIHYIICGKFLTQNEVVDFILSTGLPPNVMVDSAKRKIREIVCEVAEEFRNPPKLVLLPKYHKQVDVNWPYFTPEEKDKASKALSNTTIETGSNFAPLRANTRGQIVAPKAKTRKEATPPTNNSTTTSPGNASDVSMPSTPSPMNLPENGLPSPASSPRGVKRKPNLMDTFKSAGFIESTPNDEASPAKKNRLINGSTSEAAIRFNEQPEASANKSSKSNHHGAEKNNSTPPRSKVTNNEGGRDRQAHKTAVQVTTKDIHAKLQVAVPPSNVSVQTKSEPKDVKEIKNGFKNVKGKEKQSSNVREETSSKQSSSSGSSKVETDSCKSREHPSKEAKPADKLKKDTERKTLETKNPEKDRSHVEKPSEDTDSEERRKHREDKEKRREERRRLRKEREEKAEKSDSEREKKEKMLKQKEKEEEQRLKKEAADAADVLRRENRKEEKRKLKMEMKKLQQEQEEKAKEKEKEKKKEVKKEVIDYTVQRKEKKDKENDGSKLNDSSISKGPTEPKKSKEHRREDKQSTQAQKRNTSEEAKIKSDKPQKPVEKTEKQSKNEPSKSHDIPKPAKKTVEDAKPSVSQEKEKVKEEKRPEKKDQKQSSPELKTLSLKELIDMLTSPMKSSKNYEEKYPKLKSKTEADIYHEHDKKYYQDYEKSYNQLLTIQNDLETFVDRFNKAKTEPDREHLETKVRNYATNCIQDTAFRTNRRTVANMTEAIKVLRSRLAVFYDELSNQH